MTKIPESELILNKDGSVYHLCLKPQNIADTIITVGDPGRVHLVSRHFDSVDFEMNKREFITHSGKFSGKRVTVISTGMGTDNIEILMTELDALVNIDLKTREVKPKKKKLNIIRIGTSGSIQENIPVGSHVVSKYAIGLDSLMSFYPLKQSKTERGVSQALMEKLEATFMPYCVPASKKLLEKFTPDFIQGVTLTTPGFYAPQGRSIRLSPKLPRYMDELSYFHEHDMWISNLEMETAGYYAFGRMLGHHVVSLNAILANRVTHKVAKDPNKVVDALIIKALTRF